MYGRTLELQSRSNWQKSEKLTTDGKDIPVESLDMRCSFISMCVFVCVLREGKMVWQLGKTLNKVFLGLNL